MVKVRHYGQKIRVASQMTVWEAIFYIPELGDNTEDTINIRLIGAI